MKAVEDNDDHNRDMDPLRNSDPGAWSSPPLKTSSSQSVKMAKWRINWLKEPVRLLFLTLCGIFLATGHHLLYLTLDGRTISNDNQLSQQAVKQTGNAFAFLVIATLKAAIGESYNQYIWTVFRSRPLKIGVIEKVFSLPFKISSFLSIQLMRDAKLAFLMGALSWYVLDEIPIPNYGNRASWVEYSHSDAMFEPATPMSTLASETASKIAVIPPMAPSLNSSFHIQFYGPTVECRSPSITETREFDYFPDRYFNETFTYTESTLNLTNDTKLPCFGTVRTS